MKRTFLLLILLLFIMPTAAFAHSAVNSATPAKDSTVTASPTEVEMTFTTKIESLSTFKLYDSAGEQVETGKPEASGSTLKASLSAKLPNDTYTVKWTAVGADGHAVKGEYSFTVAALETASPSPSPSPTAEAAVTGQPESSHSPDAVSTEAAVGGNDESGSTISDNGDGNSGDEESSDIAPIIAIGSIIVVLAAIFFFFMRRRQR